MSENIDLENINLAEWYSATKAAAIISKNSNKAVSTDYLRKLAEYGKIKKIKFGDRANLYWKVDVDKYRVEERGTKSARAKKAKAKERKGTDIATLDTQEVSWWQKPSE